jgi:hypothetical protein
MYLVGPGIECLLINHGGVPLTIWQLPAVQLQLLVLEFPATLRSFPMDTFFSIMSSHNHLQCITGIYM